MLKLSSAVIFVLSIFVPSEAGVSQNNPFYCFASDPIKPQNSMFATKVAYEAARGDFNFVATRSSKKI
jgi:hypothetical protein